MKDSPEKISPLRRRMIEDMRMRKLAAHNQSQSCHTGKFRPGRPVIRRAESMNWLNAARRVGPWAAA